MADKENSPELQYSADPVKNTDKKAEKAKKESKDISLPVLAEFTITACVIILVFVFFTVVGVSLLTGANLAAFVLRTSLSTLVVGLLLVLIAREIIQGMIKAGMITNDKSDSPKVK